MKMKGLLEELESIAGASKELAEIYGYDPPEDVPDEVFAEMFEGRDEDFFEPAGIAIACMEMARYAVGTLAERIEELNEEAEKETGVRDMGENLRDTLRSLESAMDRIESLEESLELSDVIEAVAEEYTASTKGIEKGIERQYMTARRGIEKMFSRQ